MVKDVVYLLPYSLPCVQAELNKVEEVAMSIKEYVHSTKTYKISKHIELLHDNARLSAEEKLFMIEQLQTALYVAMEEQKEKAREQMIAAIDEGLFVVLEKVDVISAKSGVPFWNNPIVPLDEISELCEGLMLGLAERKPNPDDVQPDIVMDKE